MAPMHLPHRRIIFDKHLLDFHRSHFHLLLVTLLLHTTTTTITFFLSNKFQRRLFRMPPHMLRQCAALDKPFAAQPTRVRPLAGVDAPVGGQVALLRESLVAHRARVRPFAGVRSLMVLQKENA